MTRRLATIACAFLLGIAASDAAADVVVVVSADSPVESLERAQLRAIYLGERNRFPGGEEAVPIDQEEGSEARAEFYNEHLDRTLAQVKSHWSKLIFTGRGQPPRAVESGSDVAEQVAENPNAIGYLDPALVNDSLRVISIE